MTSEELLYDHYKDTCQIQDRNVKKREVYTIALCVIVCILLLYSAIPDYVETATNSYLTQHIVDVTPEFKYIHTVLLFVFLWIWMQYCQVVLTIEKTYNYIHKIEPLLLSDNENKIVIDREGGSYLSNYPWLKDFVNFIYKFLFPLIILLVSAIKIILEIQNPTLYNTISDIVILAIVFIVSILYVSNRCFHEESFSKSHKGVSFWKKICWYFTGVLK